MCTNWCHLLLQFLEVVRLEGPAFSPEDVALAQDMYLLQVSVLILHIDRIHHVFADAVKLTQVSYNILLQLCSGVDENAVGACAQLVFAPIDESFADDAPLLPSGFHVIPLDPKAVK